MSAAKRVGEYVLGIEGMALLRLLPIGDRLAVKSRMDELVRFAIAVDTPPLADTFDAPELEVVDAYQRWASAYFGMSNGHSRNTQ